MPQLQTGLDVLQSQDFASLRGQRVGVVTNPTGVDRQFVSLSRLVQSAPEVSLVAVFGPEHGLLGSSQAGVKVDDAQDAQIPVYSLYGETRRPTPAMLRGIDVLLFDIQDIGVRTYTYLATLLEVLRSAAEYDVEVWVLDRPVPLGGRVVEGPVLEVEFQSFVGPHTIPLRHGLTAGEFATMVNEEVQIDAKLKVIPMRNYSRSLLQQRIDLLWIAPSPNIPTADTALVYAGSVLIEGTNLSEGRGTTRPFHLIGAPWLNGELVTQRLAAFSLPGCRFRAAQFKPWMSKYKGEECGAVEIYVEDRTAFRPITAAVALLTVVRDLYPNQFQIDAQRFDRLAGNSRLRRDIEAGLTYDRIVAGWSAALEKYEQRRAKFLLYPPK